MSAAIPTEIKAVIERYKNKAQQVFDELSEGDKRLLEGQGNLYKEVYQELFKSDYVIRQMAREIAELRKSV